MNTINFIPDLAKEIMKYEPLRIFWEFFTDDESNNPEKPFINMNSDNLSGSLFNFEPFFCPFMGYGINVSKFIRTKKFYKVNIDDIVNDDEFDDYGEKIFCKLMIVHIAENPLLNGIPPYSILTLLSEPKPFSIYKSYKFRIPVSKNLKNAQKNYKHHRAYAFLLNYFEIKEQDDNNVIQTYEHIINASDISVLDSFRLCPSDISFPPHFNS